MCIISLFYSLNIILWYIGSICRCQNNWMVLDESIMNKGFGGSQPFMHSSSVSSCDLGEFDNWPMTLKLGDTQHFQFPEAPESASIGPWWFATDEEREKNMHDIELDEWKNPRLNKSELFLTMSWTLIKQTNLIKLWEHYFCAIHHVFSLYQNMISSYPVSILINPWL